MTTEPTVFVVDDDEEMRDSLLALLTASNLRVRTFASARDFLDAYDAGMPGCLLLDQRMPGMTGRDLQRHLRERASDLPIIFVTAFGDVPLAVQAMKDGAEYLIQKPFDPEQLLDLVHEAIWKDAMARGGDGGR